MHVHLLGICGTFMAGLAVIARELGHRVTGSDENVYPPMSDVLERAGIAPWTGYDPAHLSPAPDVVVVGNAMTRGNPCVEHILDHGLAYTSGPAWLSEHVLAGRHVIAVAGTHGKTTTSTMIAAILDAAGCEPGFLVGGEPLDFATSARVGTGGTRGLFVIEADEYDTAFFDKRSKFVHYRPRTLVLNNLEFDHADIFSDLRDMQRQFHHVVRIVPAAGRIVAGAGHPHLEEVLEMGCWTEVERVGHGADWSATLLAPDGRRFDVCRHGRVVARIEWEQRGAHNVSNALAAIAAARHAGVDPTGAARALRGFRGSSGGSNTSTPPPVSRSSTTLPTIRPRFGQRSIHCTASARAECLRFWNPRPTRCAWGPIAILSVPRLRERTPRGCWPRLRAGWDVHALEREHGNVRVRMDIDGIVRECCEEARPGDAILVMSNAGFGGIQARLKSAIRTCAGASTA